MAQTLSTVQAAIVTGTAERRRALGLRWAQAMVCSAPEGQARPCGLCRDCRKAAEGIHPDVIPVERFLGEKDAGGEIRVGTIRALRNDAFIRPNEAQRKVYLIDNAQSMNQNAQNALLKLLEEGPPYASFLLLCDRSGALLETIRSRCALCNAGEGEAPPPGGAALELGRILAGGDELEKMAFLARTERAKPDRAAQQALLSGLETVLDDAVVGGVTGQFALPEAEALARSRSRGQLLDWICVVRQAEDMLPFHVGAGHMLGWLGVRLS